MNIPLRSFLAYVDDLPREKADYRRSVLGDALREVLVRMVAGESTFDLPVSADPGGPTWAYVLSAGRRQQIDTPPEHLEELLTRSLELAESD